MHKRGNPQETFGGGQVLELWFECRPWARICVPATTCCCNSSTSWWDETTRDHVLVSDNVSNITSLSYISHSRVKESRRGVSSIILSWLDSGVSKDVMLVSSNLGVAISSPDSDVFSIFISAGVFKLPRTLSLMSVPWRKIIDFKICNNWIICKIKTTTVFWIPMYASVSPMYISIQWPSIVTEKVSSLFSPSAYDSKIKYKYKNWLSRIQ